MIRNRFFIHNFGLMHTNPRSLVEDLLYPSTWIKRCVADISINSPHSKLNEFNFIATPHCSNTTITLQCGSATQHNVCTDLQANWTCSWNFSTLLWLPESTFCREECEFLNTLWLPEPTFQGRIHVWSESAPAPLLTDKSCKFSLF